MDRGKKPGCKFLDLFALHEKHVPYLLTYSQFEAFPVRHEDKKSPRRSEHATHFPEQVAVFDACKVLEHVMRDSGIESAVAERERGRNVAANKRKTDAGGMCKAGFVPLNSHDGFLPNFTEQSVTAGDVQDTPGAWHAPDRAGQEGSSEPSAPLYWSERLLIYLGFGHNQFRISVPF